ncbi:type IV pilus biogenesis/stability protein PilW [methane-oxidizing endosymbiont of Gigantopelta aegis]|uniref:type IV pilus biogenesis/stability protein PilW n=1 Tax=methane-oxidizing endosymbiont of Gigantopelta aegis TaxID=2794938 RepID=UPI001FD9F2DC|nr:type IV pilus biogenesis/stability protein PilW [methane-oxidizing endosymbiont of Gigantopelta aegis]
MYKLSVFFLALMLSACMAENPLGREASTDEQAQVQLQLGVRYLEMGMLTEAREKLLNAERYDSQNAEVQDALAVLSERLGQREDADHHYRRAIELNPQSYSSKNNYGRFLCEAGRFDEGFKLLQEALDNPLNNRKWYAQTNIGLCYLKQGQTDLAEQAFRHALQYQPDYAPALQQMQKISYQNRRYMSARAFLQRYLVVAEHTPETLWVGWQTERALGNQTMAEKYRNQLLTRFPASKQAQQARKAINH